MMAGISCADEQCRQKKGKEISYATDMTSQAHVTFYVALSKASDFNYWIPNSCTKVSA